MQRLEDIDTEGHDEDTALLEKNMWNEELYKSKQKDEEMLVKKRESNGVQCADWKAEKMAFRRVEA